MSTLNNNQLDKDSSKEHFIHLIQVANADGVIDKSERELLHQMGKNLGLTVLEVDEFIQNKDSQVYIPSYDLKERFHLMFDVVAMAMADGMLYKNEMKMIKSLAIASSFNEPDKLINLLINGIRYTKTEEELFEAFNRMN